MYVKIRLKTDYELGYSIFYKITCAQVWTGSSQGIPRIQSVFRWAEKTYQPDFVFQQKKKKKKKKKK